MAGLKSYDMDLIASGAS